MNNIRQRQPDPKYPLGAYIKRWCNLRAIRQVQINQAIGYSDKYPLFRCTSMSIEKFFLLVDFMSKNSPMSQEFYMSRIKCVMQGKYIWTR